MLVSHNPFILPFPPFRAYQLHSSFVWKLSSPFPHLQSLPLTAHSFRLWLIPSFYLTVIQYQENATLFLPEATGSPTPILPRLPSVDTTSSMKFILVGSPVLSDHTDPSPIDVRNIGVYHAKHSLHSLIKIVQKALHNQPQL